MLLLPAFAPGCAANPPPPSFAYDRDASFTHISTYAWSDGPSNAMPRGNSGVDGQFLNHAVRDAVDNSLKKKGLDRLEVGPADVYIAYSFGNAGAPSKDSFVKTGETWFLLWTWDHLEYIGTKFAKQNVLALEVRNSRRKLIWQGARIARAGTSPEAIARDIENSVEILLSKFPPRPSTGVRQKSSPERLSEDWTGTLALRRLEKCTIGTDDRPGYRGPVRVDQGPLNLI